jgi:hypothetical protein
MHPKKYVIFSYCTCLSIFFLAYQPFPLLSQAVVTAVRAEYHLRQGHGELAAKYFAQCLSSLEPFSDTAIRLALPKLGIDDPQGYGGIWRARQCLEASNIPLITYLIDKMKIGSTNDDKMTCTMIGAWLTELFLHERGEQVTSAVVNQLTGTMEVEASQRAFLAQFLNANVSHMDSRTIMKILTSHDVGAVECAAFATKSGDISTAVNCALSGRLNEMVCISCLNHIWSSLCARSLFRSKMCIPGFLPLFHSFLAGWGK